MSQQRKPKTPEGLDDAGRSLWRRLTGRYDFDAGELPVVEAACRQVDVVAALEATVAAEGATATGSRGQPVVHPAVVEARQGRLAVAKLLGQLRLPDEDERPRTARQQQASRAALTRWDRPGARTRGDAS